MNKIQVGDFCLVLLLLYIKMQTVLVLFIAVVLLHYSQAGTVKKCWDCRHCEVTRQIKSVCKMESETGCLKFQGVDRTSKLEIGKRYSHLSNECSCSVSDKIQVTHKHCSPPSGCGPYKHNSNFSTAYCTVCTGALCNDALGPFPLAILWICGVFIVLLFG